MRTAQKFSGICALTLLGLVSACSDPVPPASQASISLDMTTAAMPATAHCQPGAHWVNVPFAAAGGQQTSATSRGAIAVDGQGQMGVKCSVKDNGAGAFSVSAELKSPAADSMGLPLSPTNITMQATAIATDQLGAPGSVDIQDNKTTSHYISEACTFTVRPARTGDQLAIAPGRIWASVACPALRDPLSAEPDAVCQISSGFIVLENCDQ